MSNTSALNLIRCSMEPTQAFNVWEMIESHDEFSGIEIAVNPDREAYGQLLAKQVPEGKVLVIFTIPHGGINMVNFFRAFRNTLNQELKVVTHKERMQ